MVAHLLDSMTLGPKILWRSAAGVLLVLMLSACTSKQVIVQGNFPEPLIEPLPLTLGLLYPDAFINHEFYDEAKGRNESEWLVKTGEAQVAFWDTLLAGMFTKIVHIRSHEDLHAYAQEVDAVLIPKVDELQYAIPLHTNVKVYEIWMRYRFRLVALEAIHNHADGSLSFNPDDSIADWTLTAYGKTPTAFLQSDESAVNLAAVVALRDAGAHFITRFNKVPEVATWLDAQLLGEL